MLRVAMTSSISCLSVACLLIGVAADADAAEKRKPTITKLEVDPSAREVELFSAMKADELSVKLVPQNPHQGNLFIENKTDEPLTVKMPQGFVGVHVHKQIGGMGGMGMGGMGGMGGGMMGGMGGGMMGGMGGGMGGGQSMGGGMGGMGGGMGGMGGGMGGMGGMGGGGMGGMGGGGFFSIPAETVARVPFKSVCLDYGKQDPSPRMTYTIVPVEEYTDNLALRALIDMVGTGQLNTDAAQAAAWHFTDNFSFAQLMTLKKNPQSPTSAPYFAPGHVAAAQQYVSYAISNADRMAVARANARGEAETVEVSTEGEPAAPLRGPIR